MTGRGCNNACTFCRDPQLMYGYKLRNRRADLVVAEMEYGLKVHPQIREIMFETDTFAAERDHVIEVCNLIIKKGINKFFIVFLKKCMEYFLFLLHHQDTLSIYMFRFIFFNFI